ncbi:hypothetical protein [Planctomicrobium piriforme]|uniref:Uncharacterized protein n=1 Tax=Planctomicrobium piriforme TaxID=1576369 RepID=A0A1I3P606_9PLAN|nr:hypothetical protein [Planctomicrobium piriforme]SFJ16988.1 hypothetical protein SAMN05421753_11649 [Planctomicrobium piriforme]
MISQLAIYGVLWWLAFISLAFVAARLGGIGGILAGQVLIAIVVAGLDIQWIQAEMHRPDWDGEPDQDIVFVIGMLIRIVLVNTVLLPVSVCGFLSRKYVDGSERQLAK